MEKRKRIAQPYRITTGCYKMGIDEKRIFLRIMEALQPDIKERWDERHGQTPSTTLFGDKIIILSTKSLLPEGSTNHRMVQKALQSLRSVPIFLKGTDKKKGPYVSCTGLILRSKYFNRSQFVEVCIDGDLFPILVNIKNGYTKFFLETAFNLSSVNNMRIYEDLSHWANSKQNRDKDKIKITKMLDVWKEQLGVQNKYKYSANFKKTVLVPAMKELKEKADLWFDIQGVKKEGRKVIGWVLNIYKKNIVPKTPALKNNLSKSVYEMIYIKLTKMYKLAPWQADRILQKVDIAEIQSTNLYNIDLPLIQKKIKSNLSGYAAAVYDKKFNLGFSLKEMQFLPRKRITLATSKY